MNVCCFFVFIEEVVGEEEDGELFKIEIKFIGMLGEYLKYCCNRMVYNKNI